MPSNRVAVIIGNPDSLFPRQLAAEWEVRGIKTIIVAANSRDAKQLPPATNILYVSDFESSLVRYLYSMLGRFLYLVERGIRRLFRENMSQKGRRLIYPSVVDGFRISRFVRSLNPVFVFGQEAFSYGFATALCYGFPRILFPWGYDIRTYAHSSHLAYNLVRWSLHHVDLVCPSSTVAAQYIRREYSVSEDKVQGISWGVDLQMFTKADTSHREIICEKYQINPTHTIVMNVRRFQPDWGAETVLKAFIQLATIHEDYHFVMLGGAGAQERVRGAKEQLSRRGLSHRFTLFEDDLPLSHCADLMSVSDVFVSHMIADDMRSLSILQATAAGGAPVLTDQPEYREMERLGFAARFVKPGDVGGVVLAVLDYGDNQRFLEEVRSRNAKYVQEYEDSEQQMDRLLDKISKLCEAYGTVTHDDNWKKKPIALS